MQCDFRWPFSPKQATAGGGRKIQISCSIVLASRRRRNAEYRMRKVSWVAEQSYAMLPLFSFVHTTTPVAFYTMYVRTCKVKSMLYIHMYVRACKAFIPFPLSLHARPNVSNRRNIRRKIYLSLSLSVVQHRKMEKRVEEDVRFLHRETAKKLLL